MGKDPLNCENCKVRFEPDAEDRYLCPKCWRILAQRVYVARKKHNLTKNRTEEQKYLKALKCLADVTAAENLINVNAQGLTG